MAEQTLLTKLVHCAREQFKLAVGQGGQHPTGVAILTCEGVILEGYALNSKKTNSPSAAAQALDLLTEFSKGMEREDMSPKLEIAEIVIARPLNMRTLAPLPADKATLEDLSNYPGTGDGQIYYLTTGNPSDTLIACKL